MKPLSQKSLEKNSWDMNNQNDYSSNIEFSVEKPLTSDSYIKSDKGYSSTSDDTTQEKNFPKYDVAKPSRIIIKARLIND